MHIHVLCLASYAIVIILISLRDTIGQRQYRDLSIYSTGQRSRRQYRLNIDSTGQRQYRD